MAVFPRDLHVDMDHIPEKCRPAVCHEAGGGAVSVEWGPAAAGILSPPARHRHARPLFNPALTRLCQCPGPARGRLLIRWEKKKANYLALLHLACAWMTFRAAKGTAECLAIMAVQEAGCGWCVTIPLRP